MDITNPSILEEEIEKKENERLELSNLIDSKNYELLNNNAPLTRIDVLNKEIESNNTKINNYETDINNIDSFINENLGPKIEELENYVLDCKNTIEEYRDMIKDQDKSIKTKASIESNITKKEKEHQILENILFSYKENLLTKIEETNLLADIIQRLTNENEKYKEELSNLKKLTMFDFKSKDITQEEKDKTSLKVLNKELAALKKRQKFDKSPDEIYDLIEMSLGDFKEKKTPDIPQESLEIDSLFDTKNEPAKLKVIDMIPVETVKQTEGEN